MSTLEERKKLLQQIWESQNIAYDLMVEYNTLPHHYGEYTMYQAEAHLINLIALYPDITITDIANILRKTPSACSQIVRKMRIKGWVEQIRNKDNNRIVNLRLTEEGERISKDHVKVEELCQDLTFKKLDGFSERELQTYLDIQKRINEAYQDDIRRSRTSF